MTKAGEVEGESGRRTHRVLGLALARDGALLLALETLDLRHEARGLLGLVMKLALREGQGKSQLEARQEGEKRAWTHLDLLASVDGLGERRPAGTARQPCPVRAREREDEDALRLDELGRERRLDLLHALDVLGLFALEVVVRVLEAVGGPASECDTCQRGRGGEHRRARERRTAGSRR